LDTVIITGSAGLIGSEAVRFFDQKGMQVVGVDNDMRREFFGEDASTEWNRKVLENECSHYRHYSLDIHQGLCTRF
jgi:CDP-paratose 2-epimerase